MAVNPDRPDHGRQLMRESTNIIRRTRSLIEWTRQRLDEGIAPDAAGSRPLSSAPPADTGHPHDGHDR